MSSFARPSTTTKASANPTWAVAFATCLMVFAEPWERTISISRFSRA
jgi:hypothetical protein